MHAHAYHLYISGIGACDSQTAYIASLADSALSGSSQYNSYHGYIRSRLNTAAGGGYTGAWSSASNSQGQYIQADLGTVRRIESIATQGRQDSGQWVQTYRFTYSVDGSSYTAIADEQGSDVIFTGNTDSNTIVTNDLETAIVARYVRLYPMSWYSHMSMRWDVYGCEIGYFLSLQLYVVYKCIINNHFIARFDAKF